MYDRFNTPVTGEIVKQKNYTIDLDYESNSQVIVTSTKNQTINSETGAANFDNTFCAQAADSTGILLSFSLQSENLISPAQYKINFTCDGKLHLNTTSGCYECDDALRKWEKGILFTVFSIVVLIVVFILLMQVFISIKKYKLVRLLYNL